MVRAVALQGGQHAVVVLARVGEGEVVLPRHDLRGAPDLRLREVRRGEGVGDRARHADLEGEERGSHTK